MWRRGLPDFPTYIVCLSFIPKMRAWWSVPTQTISELVKNIPAYIYGAVSVEVSIGGCNRTLFNLTGLVRSNTFEVRTIEVDRSKWQRKRRKLKADR